MNPPERVSPPRWRRIRVLTAGIAIALAALAGLLAWAGLSESGLRTLAAAVTGLSDGAVTIDGVDGRLLGALRIDRLRLRTADLALDVDGLELDWQPSGLFRQRRLDVSRLRADAVEFATRPAEDEPPPQPPETLRLPFAFELAGVDIDRLAQYAWPAAADGFTGAEPGFVVSAVSASAASDGEHHRLHRLGLVLPFGRAELSGEIAGTSPFALSARGRLAGEQDGRAWQADFDAAGYLLAPVLRVDAQGAGMSARAAVEGAPFAVVPLRRLQISAAGIDPAAFAAAAPTAALSIEADLSPVAGEDWQLAGPIAIDNAAAASIDRGGLPVRRLAARLHWLPAAIRVEALDLRFDGRGRIRGQLGWQAPTPPAPPAEAEAAPAKPSPPDIGRLDAVLELSDIDTARLDARLPGVVLGGRLDAAGDALRQTIAARLQAGRARLEADAALDAIETGRRFTLAGKLRELRPQELLAGAPAAVLNLDFDAEGQVGEQTQARVALRMADSRFEGHPLDGTLAFSTDGKRLADVALELVLASNRLQAGGAWGGPGDRLQVELDAPALSALGPGFSGRAGGRATIAGTRTEPAGEFEIHADALALPGNVEIAAVNAQGQLDAGIDGPVRLAVGVSGVGAQPSGGEKAETWVERGSLAIEGSRKAHEIRLSVDGGDGDHVEAELAGGLELATGDEAPQWRGRLLGFATEGRLRARLADAAALELGPRRVALGAATIELGERGRVRLEQSEWSPGRAALRGSLTGLVVDLRQAQAGERPPGARNEGRRTRGSLVLGGEWDVLLADGVRGEARLFRESGDLFVDAELGTRLALERLEARLAGEGARVALSVDAAGPELGELTGSVSAGVEQVGAGWRLDPDAALLGSARLDMPSIAWLSRLMQEATELGGSLQAEVVFSGTPSAPDASGRVLGRELLLRLIDQGLHLSGGELMAEFDRDRLRLTRLAFVSPNRVSPADSRPPVARLTAQPGSLRASGEIALDSGRGDFRFVAERLPLLQRRDRWLILSGEGDARSTWSTLDLDARLRADAGYIELADTPPPSLSDDVVVLGREEPGGEGMSLRADIRVDLGEHLYVSALGLDSRLAGTLRLHAEPGAPLRAVGTIATAGGTYRGYGQTLSVERGVVNFQGPLGNPGLNVVALRKGLPVEAGIAITGTARRPKVALVSDPVVPDPEKLSWIVLGRVPEAGSGADLGLLLPAAQALLGGPGGGMTEQLSRSLGFDQFSIGQGELNAPERRASSRVLGSGSTVVSDASVGGQVVTLGKRLSSDVFLSFEQSLGTAESLVKLTYQLSRRVSVVARGGADNAVDLYYTISFR